MELTNKKAEAFTLLEMVIVLFIISLLVCLMLPNLGRQQDNAKKVGNQALGNVITTQSELYIQEKGNKPTFEALVSEGYLTEEQVQKAKASGISADGKRK